MGTAWQARKERRKSEKGREEDVRRVKEKNGNKEEPNTAAEYTPRLFLNGVLKKNVIDIFYGLTNF